jgi:pSer/pThr/pTyr-binding forkhead associated (FHA) protein
MGQEEPMSEVNETTHSSAYLHVQRGPLTGNIIPINPGANIFGRAEGHILPDEHVSRRHAHINAVSGQYMLIDLGSSNGTLVNGQKITGPVILQHGDVIQFGGTIMGFYIRGMDGSVVAGTGAATPATAPDQLSETTLMIVKNPKQE